MLISELVGQKGAYSLLNMMYEITGVVDNKAMSDLAEQRDQPANLLSELTKSGMFIESPEGYYLSSVGRKATLLLRALNGDDEVASVFQKLSYLDAGLRPYELLTENVTDYFVDSLYARPDFVRLRICSPWIRLDADHMRKVEAAVLRASRQYTNVQVFVITLPMERYRDKTAAETVRALKRLGAEIVTNRRLHAKLYISEPGPNGGSHYAIFGSENLTGRGNIELAIKIENDNDMLGRLHQYFRSIRERTSSEPLKEV